MPQIRTITIYLSTSTLQNAVEILLNAGCQANQEDCKETAERRLERVFPIQVTDPR